jgi:hypothetical protein
MLWRYELLPMKAIDPPSMLIIQLTNNNLVSPEFQFIETVGVRCEYLNVISWLSLRLRLDCLCRELKCKDSPEQRTKTSMKLCHLLLPYERLPPQTTPSNGTAPRELRKYDSLIEGLYTTSGPQNLSSLPIDRQLLHSISSEYPSVSSNSAYPS